MDTYCLYAHVNPTNDNVYIGISKNLKARWKNKALGYKNCDKIYNALNKYGWEYFDHVVIRENLTKEEACELEKQWIWLFKTANMSYNITDGGEGTAGIHRTERHKQILREYMSNRVVSEESKRKMSETKRALHIGAKKIYAFDIRTKELVNVYNSVTDAAQAVGVAGTNIAKAARGKRPSMGGFIWSYNPTINTSSSCYNGIKLEKYIKVYCYDLHGNFLRTYNSFKEAANSVGGTTRSLSAYSVDGSTSYKHHFWRRTLCAIESEIINKLRHGRHEINKG